MHDLEGSLKVFEPISVMQMINLTQTSGAPKVITDDNSARIYFERGNVTFAGLTNRPLRLGELLLRENHIKKTDLDRVLKRKSHGKKLGTLLVEAGVIGERELRRAIEEQIKQVSKKAEHLIQFRDVSKVVNHPLYLGFSEKLKGKEVESPELVQRLVMDAMIRLLRTGEIRG